MAARVGLLVPSSNTVMEVDFYRGLPSSATLHTARMRLHETTPEGESTMLDQYLHGAIDDLATARPNVMVFGCTSAGALRGNEYEAALIRRIEHQTGAHTVSVAAAVRNAITSRAARRVGVITPYVDALNDRIRDSLEADGLEVCGVHGLGIEENFAIAAVDVNRIRGFAREHYGGAAIDVLFVSCTNFHGLDARERIEQDLGVPVVTSNHAALEAVLDHVNAMSLATA